MMRTLGGITYILLMVQLNVFIATDWWYGQRDPLGPYPRIPDKDKVKREIAFAEECRKFITPPQSGWIR
ncbi:PREDICTED: uncharacterized protein LOC105450421 [Wasmannia auropunctata]|uniref:uncharacterized protein LOC105450421 n=1 Tax=Wasmannia auropunctata TaxID=64793 RepID=UPI0005F0BFCB|nr:PREDICTED: uncharacterized protein LOC105450421 [Wasmannia auropunctata]